MTFRRVRLLLESLQPTRVTMDPKPIKLTTRILPNHPTKDLQLVQSLQILCLLEDSLQMGSKLLPQSIPKLSKYYDNFPELANCYWFFLSPIFSPFKTILSFLKAQIEREAKFFTNNIRIPSYHHYSCWRNWRPWPKWKFIHQRPKSWLKRFK